MRVVNLKIIRGAHYSDVLVLSVWDAARLLVGMILKGNGINVMVRGLK